MNGTAYLTEAIGACAGGTIGILTGLMLAHAKDRRRQRPKPEPSTSPTITEAARRRLADPYPYNGEPREEQPQPEPGHLTYEQLLPLAAAIRRRETSGHGILQPPWPGCLTCGQTPTDLLVRNDHPAHFIENRVAFGFRPCGHSFTADAYDLYRATEQP
ncbi:hypothetical protein [Streptomyces kaempferi]|uniref:Uncharacterized protein n=1 Tax=Streptomyces kaempferi TaxID=333725 RepID=A0ABW3XJG6_9ACTN